MARKYAQIFVLGHDLFFDLTVFLELRSENCSRLGTDNVRGEISVHISRHMEVFVYHGHNFTDVRTVAPGSHRGAQ